VEFSKVILLGMNDGALPFSKSLEGLADAELEDAVTRARSLLYVAVTRAREELVLSWSGKPSALLAGAPESASHHISVGASV
jgi:superfamily I DNA/RNA helicase